MAIRTYFDFAENDFQYFMNSYKHGFVANAMAADAQEICEKYMKHILSEYYDPETAIQEADYNTVMRTHNLMKIARFLVKNLDVEFTRETKAGLAQINGYYFTARYPGDESIEVVKGDIDLCMDTIQHCRTEVLEAIRKLEHKRTKEEFRNRCLETELKDDGTKEAEP